MDTINVQITKNQPLKWMTKGGLHVVTVMFGSVLKMVACFELFAFILFSVCIPYILFMWLYIELCCMTAAAIYSINPLDGSASRI